MAKKLEDEFPFNPFTVTLNARREMERQFGVSYQPLLNYNSPEDNNKDRKYTSERDQ